MKNKKKKIGFTLIELLAVIIVLAIIALIATPIIFNVIENAKLKSLENSCYGIIDGVRTKYAEGLLNSIDGTVKLKGNVTEITVSGEQPIAGTWEIDNSSDSDNRGIKIKDVKFGSMKDYTCTNVNSDGTINSKVTCTKGGSEDIVETDLSCFDYEKATVLEVDETNCPDAMVSLAEITKTEAENFCNGTGQFDNLTINDLLKTDDEEELQFYIDEGILKKSETNDITINGYKCYEGNSGNLPTITDIVIPSNTKTINKMAFALMNITSVNFDKAKNLSSILDGAFYFDKITNLTIPDSVTIISDSAFANNQLTNVTIPNGVTTIGSHAFAYNSLASIIIPDSVTSIGEYAFHVNNLSSVKMSDNMITIGDYAFSNNKMVNIKLPNSVTTISDNSFYNNPNLKLIEIDKTENSISGSPWGADNATITWLR